MHNARTQHIAGNGFWNKNRFVMMGSNTITQSAQRSYRNIDACAY